MKRILLYLFFLLSMKVVTAQTVTMEYKVTAWGANYNDKGDNYGARLRFYRDSWNEYRRLICIQEDRQNFDKVDNIYFSNPAGNWAGTTNLVMVTHHERKTGSDPCTVQDVGGITFNVPDLHEASTTLNFTPLNIPQGVWWPFPRMRVYEGNTIVYADVSLKLPVLASSAPKLSDANGSTNTFCTNNPINIATTPTGNGLGLKYTWEYAFAEEDYNIKNPDKCFCEDYNEYDGCGHWEIVWEWGQDDQMHPYDVFFPSDDCAKPDSVTIHHWQTLSTGTDATTSFDPAALFSNGITSTRKVHFRVKAVSSLNIESPYSELSSYFFLPPAPKIDASQKIEIASCFNEDNGQVIIPKEAIVCNYPNLRWLIRKGINNTAPCDPRVSTGDSACGDVNWSNGAEPANKAIVVNSLKPGDYSLWVLNPGSDAGNCYTPISVHIGELAALAVPANLVVATNISCNGANDGKLSVTATGGDVNAGYIYTLMNQSGDTLVTGKWLAGNTFVWNNLPAGDYTAVVRNGACRSIVTVKTTLTQPPLITGQITLTQPDCNTPGNGAINIVAVPVATNYQYRLYENATLLASSPVTTAASYTFKDLHSGTYKVEILNADYPACTGWTSTTTLNVVPALTIKVIQKDSVSCFGGNDGHIAFSATGGSGQYRYVLTDANNNPINSNTGDFSNLSAGKYNVKVYNRNVACTDNETLDVDVFQRAPLTVALTKTDVTCNGAADGTLRAVAAGGSSSYKYTWQQFKNGSWIGNSFWFSTDIKIEALDPGTYRVIVADLKSNAGCTVTSSTITIAEPTKVVLGTVSVTDAVCLADGAKLVTSATGGDGVYTFAWSNNNGVTYTPFASPLTIRQAGDYLIKVTDGKGCSTESTTPKTISLPAVALSFTATVADYHGFNVSCKDATDGKITVVASGGNGGSYAGYSYKLNNGSYQASNIFNNLSKGTYVVTVTDGRGCEVSQSYTLVQPDLQLSVTKQDITCFGASTGTLTATVSGGAVPYQVKLNGNLVNIATPINSLAKGTYLLQVTDANGCSKDTSINIVYMYPQVAINTATATDIRCLGEKGMISLNGTGGDNNYSFSISDNNWATASSYTSGAPLVAGSYKLRITDGKGCKADYPGQLTITAPPSVITFSTVLSDYNGFNISCVGGNNGSIQISAVGGNGNAYTGYTYAIDNGAFSANPFIQSVYAGPHQIKVQDGRGCVVTKTVALTESARALSIVLSNKQDVRCASTPGGSITVSGSGGVGQLQYSIDGGANWQAGTTFSGLVAGDYHIQVKDVNSCSNAMDVTVASLNPPITIDNITTKDIICFGTTGTIALQSHGGSGTLINQYAVNGNAYTNFTNTTPLVAGTYKVRVADGIGCYSVESAPISITSPAAPLNAIITTSNYNGRQISCYGLQDGKFDIAASGGNGAAYTGYTYSINTGAYTGNTNYANLSAGNYAITIKDGRGCVINKSVNLTQPAAAVTLAANNIVHLDCGASPTGKFDLQANGGTSPYAYTITGTYNNNNSFTNLNAGIYNAQVIDVNGCAATTTTTIRALYPAISATEVITPVNCFGETSGAIRVAATGGNGVFSYQWSNGAGNSLIADRIPAGTYDLRITDGKGCYKDYTYTVTQPELLTMVTTAAPVCDGLNDGTIQATVTGGTSPYNYSLNNGGLTANALFQGILPGSYNLLVKDAHGCTTNKDLKIEKANVKPDVDFLVASRKNAMDTLAIKEINLPAPDNVYWSFHPMAILLGYNEGSPIVKFSTPGTYWIEMKATFGACTYTLRKNITIDGYDPTAGPSYSTPIQVIDQATLSPNPNTGVFKLNVKLNRKQQAIVTVFDINGKIYDKRQYNPALTIEDQFSLNNALTGTYVLRIVTENESRDIRFIITR
ncbi:T9SS type A sorting domain-containing protein [Chitinophaga sp. Hz27]|uniref:T9SS type A sorting domain-containing protein n=1 Tax=Chitinophaga sp. Hz27 TaxID=3347169 RepID=UPI0035D94B56